jgi:hypothetical protein
MTDYREAQRLLIMLTAYRGKESLLITLMANARAQNSKAFVDEVC